MRISTSVMNQLTADSMSSAYDTYYNVINKINSGKNFTKISQDVIGANKVLKLNDSISKLNEYQSNIQTALDQMNMSYDVLDDVNDELTSINSLVVEAANATTTPDSAKAIATEVQERVATIVNRMNTKYLDDYLFSGTNTQNATYSKNTDEEDNINYIYQGSSTAAGDRKITISEGTTMAYNVTGESIFKTDDEGNNFFSEMNDLCKLLNSDSLDYDAIRSKLDVINKAQTSVANTNGQLSAKVIKLNSTKEINDSTLTDLTESKSNIEEVDLTKAATDLTTAQYALQASYTLSNTILSGVSLLDYI